VGDDQRSSLGIEHPMIRGDVERSAHDGDAGKRGLTPRNPHLLDVRGRLSPTVVLGNDGARCRDDDVGNPTYGAKSRFVTRAAKATRDSIDGHSTVDRRDHVGHHPRTLRWGGSLVRRVESRGVDVVHRGGEELIHTRQRYRRCPAPAHEPKSARCGKLGRNPHGYSQLVLFSPTGMGPYRDGRSRSREPRHAGGTTMWELDPRGPYAGCQRVQEQTSVQNR